MTKQRPSSEGAVRFQIVREVPGLPNTQRWVGAIVNPETMLVTNYLSHGELAAILAAPAECRRPVVEGEVFPSPLPSARQVCGRRQLPEHLRLHRE